MSREIVIPGGTAQLRDQAELTERRRRPSKTIIARLGKDAQAKMAAWEAGTVELSQTDAELLFANNDAVIWCYLKSWTLDRPLPDPWQEVGNLPGDLYDALLVPCLEQDQVHAEGAAGFTVDAVEDDTSPTGASDA